jgi:hypothetical protein
MATIEELRSLLANVRQSAPSPQLDQNIGAVLGLLPDGAKAPQWTASVEEALNLFNRLLSGRPMEIVPYPERDGYFCTVKLYGSMPATAPCIVHFAKTAAMALMVALIETLLAIEIDSSC